jgi:hypothetical protein
MGKDLKIFFERSHENRRIIGIEGGANHGATTTKTMEISTGRGYLKEMLKGIYGDVEQKGDKGSSWRSPLSCTIGSPSTTLRSTREEEVINNATIKFWNRAGKPHLCIRSSK